MPRSIPCPVCAETIPEDTVRCRHCGELLATPGPARGGGGGVVAGLAVLGALGLCCVLGAAVAIPSYAPSRLQGNEAAAIGALKTVCTAQSMFQQSDQDRNGRMDFGVLADLGRVQYIDPVLASGTKQGYVFDCQPTLDPTQGWAAAASPALPGTTGTRCFGIDQTGVILFSRTAPFSVQDGVLLPPPDAVPIGR